MCLALAKEAPQVDPVSLASEAIFCLPLSVAYLICGPHFSLLSTWTPSTLTKVLGCPWKPRMLIVALMSSLFRCLVRCSSWYLPGANVAPCFRAQSRHFSYASSSTLQFCSADLLHVMMFVSSTNPFAAVFPLSSSCKSGAAKKRKRIGHREEPWGIPVCVFILAVLSPSKNSCVVLSVRKDWMKFTTQTGILACLILCSKRSWTALSKAPEMSRLSIVTTTFGSQAYAVRTCSVMSSSAVSVDLPRRAPICVSGSSLCSSTASATLRATILSSTLPIVLISAIGR